MVALGSRIRERRAVHDLTLADLAERSGTTKGFLSQVENGLSQPTAWPLLHIAQALKVSVDWLLTGGAEGRAA